jgi:hypothetical protein
MSSLIDLIGDNTVPKVVRKSSLVGGIGSTFDPVAKKIL